MKPDSELPISILYVRPPPHIIMRTQPLRLQREFVQKDNPRIRTDDYPYNAKRRGVSFSRAFLNAIAPRPSATPDESPDRVGPSCLRWAHLCFFYATRIMPVRVRIDCATAGLSTQAKPLRTASVAARNHLQSPATAPSPTNRNPGNQRTHAPSFRQKNRAILTFSRHACHIR